MSRGDQADYKHLSSENPFWFVSEEVLVELLRDEIYLTDELLEKHPDIPQLFDLPNASVEQRATCFALLAHRNIMSEIYDKFVGLHQQPPSLGEAEQEVLRRTADLFDSDAPTWVLEIREVAERLPSRIFAALPQPLLRGGFNAPDPKEAEDINSAANKMNNLELIQALNRKVFDQQLQRLQGRWSAGTPVSQTQHSPAAKRNRLSGTEGLVRKADLSKYSHYMDKLTEKQRLAFALKYEYGLTLTEIASRMGKDRKTADEHIKAAEKKVEQARSNAKAKVRRARFTSEF